MLRRSVFLILALVLAASWALPAAAAEEIKIGVLYPLTGGAAAEGKELRERGRTRR